MRQAPILSGAHNYMHSSIVYTA